MWVTKDEDGGRVCIYKNKPTEHEGMYSNHNNKDLYLMTSEIIIKELFGIEDLTFENSPIEIKTEIIKK